MENAQGLKWLRTKIKQNVSETDFNKINAGLPKFNKTLIKTLMLIIVC